MKESIDGKAAQNVREQEVEAKQEQEQKQRQAGGEGVR